MEIRHPGVGLFEVSDYGTLSFANFEEPTNRADAFLIDRGYFHSASDIERYRSLADRIREPYRDELDVIYSRQEDAAWARDESFEWPDLDEMVENEWGDWFDALEGEERAEVDGIIDEWLAEEPDWCNEGDERYKTATAQGAAYDHFLCADRDVMEALEIVVVEEGAVSRLPHLFVMNRPPKCQHRRLA